MSGKQKAPFCTKLYRKQSMTITERIRAAAKERGISQQQMADEMSVSVTTIKSNLQQGDAVSVTTLRRYAEVLNVPDWTLLADVDEVRAYLQQVDAQTAVTTTAAARCPICGAALNVELHAQRWRIRPHITYIRTHRRMSVESTRKEW